MPYEVYGVAANEAGLALPLGTPIRTFIDGVDYSNLTSTYRADGSYQTQIAGNHYIGALSETPWIKEGGDPGDPIAFADGDLTTGGRMFRQTAAWQTAAFNRLDLQEAVSAKQPTLLKIQAVTTRPADGLSQYVYLCNPTGSAVNLADYYFQKDIAGSFSGPTAPLTGTVGANAKVFGDLPSTSFLTPSGDILKLVWRNPGGADSPFGGSDVVVDRVEFNATTGGALTWEPGNTIMTDAPAPGLGQEIHRTASCADTNRGADFTLGPEAGRPTVPTVAVSTPNGGEDWTGGTPHRIWWNMSDVQDANNQLSVRINYSVDGGAVWTVVVPAQPGAVNPNSHDWNVPTEDATTARVQVCVTDSTGFTGCDVSDADFRIDSTPSTATTTPADAATGVALTAAITLAFSEAMNRTSVQTGFVISPDIAGKAFIWAGNVLTVDHALFAAGTTYIVTLTGAKDRSDPGNTMSTLTFLFTTVTNRPPTVAVTAPAAGSRFTPGDQILITWTMNDDRTVSTALIVYVNYTSSAGSGAVSTSRLVGSTSFTWTAPDIDAGDVRIQVTVIDEQSQQTTADSGEFAIRRVGMDLTTIAVIAAILIIVVAALVVFLVIAKRRRRVREEAPPAPVPKAPPAPAAWAPPPPPPPPAAGAGTKECPSCGTVVDAKDPECFRCGRRF